jgi:hypothetical protein
MRYHVPLWAVLAAALLAFCGVVAGWDRRKEILGAAGTCYVALLSSSFVSRYLGFAHYTAVQAARRLACARQQPWSARE